jgi:hypothetical protein
MVKKEFLISIIFSLMIGPNISADEYILINNLRDEIICKNIFDYFVSGEYQNNYKFIYETLYGENGLFESGDAFKILLQKKNNYIYKNVEFIESYTYYGINIEIHKIPCGESNSFYIAKNDITSQGLGYELLLFSNDGIYFDKYTFMSINSERPRTMYEYVEIYENYYGIVTLSKTHIGKYLHFIIIENSKFKELFAYDINDIIKE